MYKANSLYHPLRGQKKWLAVAVPFFAIKSSPEWILPVITANVVDIVAQSPPDALSRLGTNAAILAIVLGQIIPMEYFYKKSLSTAVRSIEADLRMRLCRHLQRLSIEYYSENRLGVLHSKLLRDVDAVIQLIADLFASGLTALVNITFAFAIIAYRQPQFLLVFLITPVSAGLMYYFRRPLSKSNELLRKDIEEMSARLLEMLHLMRVTRAHGLETAALDPVKASITRVQKAESKVDILNTIFGSLMWGTHSSFTMICLIVSAWFCLANPGVSGPGNIVLLTTYFGLITSSIFNFMSVIPSVSKGLESVRSIDEVLQCTDLEPNNGKHLIETLRGDISFENVTFSYRGSNIPALNNFSLFVPAGNTVALVGHSGAGKSTLLNLTIGFIQPVTGLISVDGMDIRTIDMKLYRSFLSVVSQEPILFHGTVRDNVAYGMPTVSFEAIQTALKDANAWEFVSQLPAGIDTIVGENGSTLSGGQKQRLTIARALIRNPKILILDEATSSVDTESEILIQDALKRLMKGRTTIIVAHRLSTVRDASQIVVLANGAITEIGTHEELLRTGGQYSRILEKQLTGSDRTQIKLSS